MKLINLLTTTVRIRDEAGDIWTFPPGTGHEDGRRYAPALIQSEIHTKVPGPDGIDCFHAGWRVDALPDPLEGYAFLVPRQVAAAAGHRTDLFYVDGLSRVDNGVYTKLLCEWQS